eukprot:scaffold25925_cov59-Attheya_sp.AAC.8
MMMMRCTGTRHPAVLRRMLLSRQQQQQQQGCRPLLRVQWHSTSSAAAAHVEDGDDELRQTTTTIVEPTTSKSKSNSQQSFLVNQYNDMIDSGQVEHNPVQMRSLWELDRLRSDVMKHQVVFATMPQQTKNDSGLPDVPRNDNDESSSSSLWNWVVQKTTSTLPGVVASKAVSRRIPGVYLHGGVGCGKTFLMDLFFQSLQGKN